MNVVYCSSMEKMLSNRLTLDLEKFVGFHPDADALVIENFIKNISSYRIKEMGFSVDGEIKCFDKNDYYHMLALSDDIGRIVFSIDKPIALEKTVELEIEDSQLY